MMSRDYLHHVLVSAIFETRDTAGQVALALRLRELLGLSYIVVQWAQCPCSPCTRARVRGAE